MVKRRLGTLVAVLFLGSVSMAHKDADYKAENCFPKNDLNIPTFVEGQGLSEQDFNDVLDRIEEVYAPIVKQAGGELEIKRLWSNGTVNASANRLGDKYILNMYGGLARHRVMTKDGFALVACHELGHHLGGAPKIGTRWASNEGQSDYYAGLKCLRRVLANQKNASVVTSADYKADDTLAGECQKSFRSDNDVALCVRSGMGGMAVSLLFKDLRKENKNPAFDTPDQKVVSETYHGHPATQCRLDTYLAGAVCTAKLDDELDDKDADAGTCSRKNMTRGVRPLCWYADPHASSFDIQMASFAN